MSFRSSPSSFQLLATLILFALLVSPMFASPVFHDNQFHDSGPKQDHVVDGKNSGEASSLEDDKHIIGTLRGGYGSGYGYGGLGSDGYRNRNCGGLGMRRGGSSCICHCMNGRVATPQEVLQSAATTKP